MPLEHILEHEENVLSQLAFNRLLEWLDDGVESHGEAYLEMRRRLVAYFDRRNRTSADELADETLNRVARTLATAGTIAVTPPARYCYVVARFVLLEDFRRERAQFRVERPWNPEDPPAHHPVADQEGAAAIENRLECLDGCLRALKPDQRELVLEYYRDTGRRKIERRRDLAARLGISMNALGIRACRIRATLEACFNAARKGP